MVTPGLRRAKVCIIFALGSVRHLKFENIASMEFAGTQRSGSTPGLVPLNEGGAIPVIVKGTSSIEIEAPMARGLRANSVVHRRSLITADQPPGGPPGVSSSAVRRRPACGWRPSTGKNEPVTLVTEARCGTPPYSRCIEPPPALPNRPLKTRCRLAKAPYTGYQIVPCSV